MADDGTDGRRPSHLDEAALRRQQSQRRIEASRRLRERARASAAASREQLERSQRALSRALDGAEPRTPTELVVLYLVRRIAAVKPGQEAELDQVERDIDRWLTLNQSEQYGPALRRRIAERRARLASQDRP